MTRLDPAPPVTSPVVALIPAESVGELPARLNQQNPQRREVVRAGVLVQQTVPRTFGDLAARDHGRNAVELAVFCV